MTSEIARIPGWRRPTIAVALLSASMSFACFGVTRMPMRHVNAYTLMLFDRLGLDPVELAMRKAELNVRRYPLETAFGKRLRYGGPIVAKYRGHERVQQGLL